jgi:hypothetical protein
VTQIGYDPGMCWASNVTPSPHDGSERQCFSPVDPTDDIGLCPFHYREIAGRAVSGPND